MKLRNLKAEAAAAERRRVQVEEARGRVEVGKIDAERAVFAEQLRAAQAESETRAKAERAFFDEQMRAAQAERQAAEARLAAATLERDRAAQERDAAVSRDVQKDSLIAATTSALEEQRAAVRAQAAALAEIAAAHVAQTNAVASFMVNATAKIAAMEMAIEKGRSEGVTTAITQMKAVADRAHADLGATAREVRAQLTSLGANLRSDIAAIAAAPVDMSAWKGEDGKMHATMTRKP